MTDDWAGRIIDGRYAVESVLGSGGMGLVLKAKHKFTGVEVAVKVLRPELELDPEVQMRFLGEARAPNAIGHPGIVQVIDAGKSPDGVLYLVMELLHGRPLRQALVRGELPPAEMRRIMMELFDTLGAAHIRGFVHRDLKPENVFLAGPQGAVKLLDFGIAKVLDSGLARVRTQAGATLGTPAYMAPEQFNDPSSVDARADLWALGVMIYEMMTGRLPFHGDTVQALLLAVATQEPTPIRAYLPNADLSVEAFFVRALARNLKPRFVSAQEMAQVFAALPLGAPSLSGVGAPMTKVKGSAEPAGYAPTMATGPGPVAASTPLGGAHTGYAATMAPALPVAAQTPYPVAQPPMAQPPMAHAPMPQPPMAHAPMPQPPMGHAPMPQPPMAHAPMAQPQMAHAQPPIAATPNPAASRTLPTGVTQSRSRAGLLLAIAGVVALICATIIVVAGRRSGGGGKAAVPIDAATVAVITPPVDAAVVAAAVDAGVLDAHEPPPPPADAAPRPKRVDAAVAKVDPSAPVDPYAGSGGGSAIAKPIPKPSPCAPKGTASCRAAMKCQNSCEDDDDACRCNCRATVSPANARELDAFAKCSRDCGYRNMCQLRSCGGETATCLAK